MNTKEWYSMVYHTYHTGACMSQLTDLQWVCNHGIASFPGLLMPVFVTCSTNAGEGLVKLVMCSDIGGRYVDVRKSGVFLLYSSGMPFWTQEMSTRAHAGTRRTVIPSCGKIFRTFDIRCLTSPVKTAKISLP